MLRILEDKDFVNIDGLVEQEFGEERHMFRPKEIAQVVGISYRQIQYWDDSKFISPSCRRRGKFRTYTSEDLFNLVVAKDLRNRGATIQGMRSMIPELNHAHARLGTLNSYSLRLEHYLVVRNDENNHAYLDLSKVC